MIRFLLILLIALQLPLTVVADNNAKRIKQEQREAQKAIKEGKKKLKENKQQINTRMKELKSLQKEISEKDNEIRQIETELTGITDNITATTAEIDSLNRQIKKLRDGYAYMLRKVQSMPVASSPLAFIFSAKSMNDLYHKLRQIKTFNRWRGVQEKKIAQAADELNLKRVELEKMQQSQQSAMGELNRNKALLKTKENKTDQLVAQLKKSGGQMSAEISKRERQLEQLNRKLNKILEAERKAREAKAKKAAEKKKKQQDSAKAKVKSREQASDKPAKKPEPQELIADEDRQLNGSFESNKGRLLFPVSGRYKVVRNFGRGYYSSKVQTSHVGIDIEVPLGASARAIFEGVVSNVTYLDGFNNIVVVRHGSYLAVYINIASSSVKEGQKVVKGQLIGTVGADEEGQNGLLQFGLRKERVELNPLQWVK